MRLLLVLSAVTATVMIASAQSNSLPTQSFSLDDSIQMALQHNFDLQIERYNPQLSRFSLSGAYGAYEPVFNVSGEHGYSRSGGGVDPVTKLPLPASESEDDRFASTLNGLLPLGTTYNFFGSLTETYGTISGTPVDNTRGSVGVNVTQPLLKNFWFDGTRLRIAVAKNRVKFSEQELRTRLMDVTRDVEKAYYDLIAARENVKVQEKGLELAGRLLAENKRRVEVGALAPLDEKQAESEAAGRRTDLITAQQALASQQNTLKLLLSDNYRAFHDTNIDASESLAAPVQPFDLQNSWARGMEQRPELVQAKLDLERQGIQLRYDKNQLFPQLDLYGTYGHSAGGVGISEFSQGLDQLRRDDQPFYTYGASLGIPLGNRTARYAYRSTKLTLQQTLLTLKKLEQGILAEIDNSVIAARASLQRVESTRQARLYSEAALDAEQKKLENGKSTSFVVLQLQRDLTAARSSEIAALADYNKALSDLARSEGTTLDRRGVRVDYQ